MKIRALKALTIRDSETGDLTSIAHGAIADVDDTLGQSLIEDGLAEAYEDGPNYENFKKAVDKSITSITADMLEGMTEIGSRAFYSCFSLISVEIPASVTAIKTQAFGSYQNLESLTVLATTPPTLGQWAIEGYGGTTATIYVPAESVEAYKAASGWSNYASQIQAIPS